MWRSGTFPEKPQVSECATDLKQGPWNDWAIKIRQPWWCFFCVQKATLQLHRGQYCKKKWVVLTHFGTSILYFSTSLENFIRKCSPMTFINVLQNRSIVGMQSRQWDPTVFNDAEEVQETKVTKLSQNHLLFLDIFVSWWGHITAYHTSWSYETHPTGNTSGYKIKIACLCLLVIQLERSMVGFNYYWVAGDTATREKVHETGD